MSNENEELKVEGVEEVTVQETATPVDGTEVEEVTAVESVVPVEEPVQPVAQEPVEEAVEAVAKEPVEDVSVAAEQPVEEAVEAVAENTATAVEDAAPEEEQEEETTERAKALSPGMTVLKRFFRSKLSVIGLVTIIVLFLLAFLGPAFSPWGYSGTIEDTNPELIKEALSPTYITYIVNGVEYNAVSIASTIPNKVVLGDISATHWMGTDDRGLDVFTRLMCGGRISLTIGFVVVILETILGVLFGGLAGYFGKWVDNLIMRIVDILSCIPTLPIMLILSVIFNAVPGLRESDAKLYLMFMILCLIGWTGTARLVRGQILSLREQEFMLAAKAQGLSTRSKIFKHLLPNVIPQLIVSMTLGLGSIILMEATLGFLGLGAPPSTATWGNMINLANNSYYRQYYSNLWLGSGICITLAILAFNFVGDGLRDAFDPKMKR